MMTREDMLRELELLPVWTLNTPQLHEPESKLALVQTEFAATESIISAETVLPLELEQVAVSLLSTETLPILIAETFALESLKGALDTVEPVIKEFTHIVSEDNDWLFVLSDSELQPDEALLLRNILIAMRIKAKPANTLAMTSDVLAIIKPKIIVAMGEAATQHLLQSSENMINLRGKLQKLHDVMLVSTYDLTHLLSTTSDKAKAWDDLCIAMHALEELKSIKT